jgi:hypothetical protein
MTINAALTTIARRELGYPVLVDIRDGHRNRAYGPYDTYGQRLREVEVLRVITTYDAALATADITHAQMLDHDGSICHLRRQTLDTLLAELHEQYETEAPA